MCPTFVFHQPCYHHPLDPQSKLLRPNSKRCKLYIYGELQKILDQFHPSIARFAKIRFAKFYQEYWISGRQVWHAFESTILILYRQHLLSNWAHIFCDLFLCAPCWKKYTYQKYKRKKGWEKKRKIVNEKTRKEEHIGNN